MPLTRVEIDDYDLGQFAVEAAAFGTERYGYVVTPNADHLIRLDEDAEFRAIYAQARYVLLDSRFISRLVGSRPGRPLPVCAGSDLTERLFETVIQPQDRLVLIGAEPAQARALAERYGLRDLHHHNPPMGFANDPVAVEAALAFIEAASPFRICLLAVGTPRGEMLAQRVGERGRARGLALCIGASVNFLTGAERRAPVWMRRLGLEWLYRLLSSPRRLGHRYLVRGPRVFALLRRIEFVLRPPTASALRRE